MMLLPRVLSLLVALSFVTVCCAEESEAPQLHELKSTGSEAPQLDELQSTDSEAPQAQPPPPEEDGNDSENNASHQCAASGAGNCATTAGTGGAPEPADDDTIESVLRKIKAAPEVKMEYFARLPSGPGGEEHDHRFPIKFSPSQMATFRGGTKEAGQATLLLAIYQARPQILALKPWKCQICGRPARTTLGSPAFIPATTGGIIIDAAPFVLCGDMACEEEAKRQTKDLLRKVSLHVEQGQNKIPLKLNWDNIDAEADDEESGEVGNRVSAKGNYDREDLF